MPHEVLQKVTKGKDLVPRWPRSGKGVSRLSASPPASNGPPQAPSSSVYCKVNPCEKRYYVGRQGWTDRVPKPHKLARTQEKQSRKQQWKLPSGLRHVQTFAVNYEEKIGGTAMQSEYASFTYVRAANDS